MGKLGPRLDSRKKAKRWAKGQSSSSNPETTKHREQATWMFFKDFSGTPGITKEDLQKHDAIQGIQPQFEKLDIDGEQAESTVDGTANTFDTFASNYSNCSNMSFNRFLSHFQSKSLLHKEMLAVLSAVTEVIKQNGGSETSTEYFAALMSTLEAIESDISVAATLSLLGMGLKTVPRSVLNVQFGQASQVFLEILSKHAAAEEYLILRHCIHCLSLLLRAQELASWSNPSTMQVLDAVLAFTTHCKPKVRKAAQHGVCAILKGGEIMKGDNPSPWHPAAPQIAKHCIAQLQAGSEPGGITSILHILMLLKDITHQLPKTHVKTICEALLRIMGLKNVLVTSCCLQTLHGLFVSRPPEAVLPAQRNAQIITALYDYQPPATDSQPTLAWLTVMQEAHVNLAQNGLHMCAAVVPKMLGKCTELWMSDKADVISGTSHTIKVLLQDCVGPMCENDENIKRYNTCIDQIIQMMHVSLGYQYLEAWYHVLHLTALLFQVTGKSRNPKLFDIVHSLADLRDSCNFTSKSDTEYAIGAAIRALGPESVLTVIPLNTGDSAINLKRGWILPLLKDCLTHGTLAFFVNTLLPLANLAEQKMSDPVGGKTYEFLVAQIWSILPSICNDASDVKANFRNVAKLLGVTISEKKDLRLPVMSALRKLIIKAVEKDSKEDIAELAKFAKNYLPLFLNLYTMGKPSGTDEEGQRLAAFDTIRVYLKITSKELINELFDRALSKLKEPNADEFLQESVHDVIRALVEYTDTDRLKIFYDICVPSIKKSSKVKEQKKAYRFLEDVCGSEKEVCKNFVLQHRREIENLLSSSIANVEKPSRGARLRCLIHLIKSAPQVTMSQFMEVIVPEAVICVKDLNTRCRTSAYDLLNCLTERFLETPEELTKYINLLTAGMGGETKYCSASLLAFACITYRYNGSLGVETVKQTLEHACTLAVSPTREVAESALSYIKVYITVMPSPTVASSLPRLVEALSKMPEDCQRHFRQKVRDIFTKLVRKYGVQTISGMIPANDVMLHKRLKNIHKVEEAKKKNRELKKSKQTEEDKDAEFSAKRRPKSIEEILADSEEEFDGTENDEPKKNKKRKSRKEAWIQENEGSIVDLVDPAAARNISTTQPGGMNRQMQAKKTKDRGFKTAPDGRLIIADDNERDEEETQTKKKKIAPFLHSDSEDDYEDDDAQSVATSKSMARKRKHSENSDNMSLKSQATSKYQAGGSGIHRPLKKGKVEQTPGAEYRSKKATGDIKKKGKPEPYAYLPLTRSALNKRKKKKNAGKFQGIIQGAKKGAKAGMKNKKKNEH